MWYLVYNDHQYRVFNVVGFIPEGYIGCLPDAEIQEQYPFIIQENDSFQICHKKLSKWMKEQIKNGV